MLVFLPELKTVLETTDIMMKDGKIKVFSSVSNCYIALPAEFPESTQGAVIHAIAEGVGKAQGRACEIHSADLLSEFT